MSINLTEEQLNILLAFLGRVDLKGNEVPAFNEILQQINKASAPKTEEPKEDKGKK